MKYQVGVKIYNSFEVEASSEQEAEDLVRELDVHKTLIDCDYNICYIDEIKQTENLINTESRDRAIEGKGWY